ncbi:molybdopterin-dependent oxidoreductase [Deinococcus sp. KNUC1210]|uniref:molybdopterin-dependent oxidoreductase n=1 Tax=Deinococcus sp. KNUC1210 TaxID=2917691 RepID=UPI001EF01DB2|nr:molybdopterin-dependent oxidoreductase [Deinococcus sp. KNUC1210]ULH14358.1 molybdopterin-dependent oxidoreductase [Deinococcus sp. KNUC1210]
MSFEGRRRRLWLVLLGLLGVAVCAFFLWDGLRVRSTDSQAGAFSYQHAALPLPASRPGEAVVFTLQTANGKRGFTLRQFQALPAVRYAALQPQVAQQHTYQGVALRDLAEMAGVAGQDVRVMGSDDFGATIQAADYMKYPVMIAYSAEGQSLTPAQKGPLMVVFPNVQAPQRFPSKIYGSQWVWFAESLGRAP